MSLDQINEQIANAQRAAAAGAAQAAPAVGTAVAGTATAVPAVGTVAAGKPVSLGELLAEGGMRVDAYLKVDKLGFLIGTDLKNAQDELDVEFVLADVVPFWGLRYGQQPVTYRKSFDRIVESRSKKPWAQCVAEAQAADARCRGDYPSADIPFTILKDVKAEKGDNAGKNLVSEGQTVGLTLSITNFKDFAAFIKPYEDMRAAGQLADDVILKGKLKHVTAEGGGNIYGKAHFVDFTVVGFRSERNAAADAAADAAAQD